MTDKTGMDKNAQLKIALIGPIVPYRSGIAQYTAELHKVLAKHCQLQTISFKRLYPSWLYPGESDKEPGKENYRMPGVDYIIDVYSPWSLRKTTNRIMQSGCDVAILSWWTLIWQPGLFYMARRLRRRGVKVIFLCHNLFDHDAQGMKRKVAEKLLRQADGYIVHSTEGRAILNTVNPGVPVLQRLHPIYGQFPKAEQKLEKRGRLELLFFGLVRPYKGLDILVQALAQLNDKEIYLTAAGEAWGHIEQLRQWLLAMGAPNIDLQFGWIDEKTAANYFERADVVALPYRSATGSGVLSLAYGYRKPVLATRVGGLTDGVIEGKTGWIVDPNSPEALARAIAKIKREEVSKMKHDIIDFCQIHNWDNMAKEITQFAANLAAAKSRR